MFSMAYVSRAAYPFGEEELSSLAEHAGRKNRLQCITGYLCYIHGDFFQYLEGDERSIVELMNTISQDDRHEILSIVRLGEHDERRFPSWSMRYVSHNRLCEIQMEHVLYNVLKDMKVELFGEDRIRETVQRIVGRVAEIRARL